MKTKLLALFTITALASCEETKKVDQAIHEDAGKLPDGRTVKYVKRFVEHSGYHHIYYVENPDGSHSVTTNYPSGKAKDVTVFIDGDTYEVVEKKNKK
jgi:hypothetical protein